MATDFDDLGATFPLFAAAVEEAAEYVGLGTCSLTGEADVPCFRLGMGCALMLECPECHAINGLDCDEREDEVCHECADLVRFPGDMPEEIIVCYRALRDFRAAISKDTEYGMITWEQVQTGLTHGVPGGSGLRHSERVPLVEIGEDWVGARLDPRVMRELLTTPTYISWQGERWLFDGGTPGVYQGCWTQADFKQHAGTQEPQSFFEQVIESKERWMWKALEGGRISVYVFRMPSSGNLRAHWDMD